jgi:hypothetical protein
VHENDLTFALVTWDRHLYPEWRYFATCEAAYAARPQTGQPWSVVDTAVQPEETMPSIPEIAKRGRGVIETPWPKRKGDP